MLEEVSAQSSHDAPILIVEDDLSLRDIIRWALEDEGFAVEAVSDGEQAVSRLTQRRPALVVLDWGLPLRDGAGVAASLRTVHGPGVPILLITADGRSAEKARRVGAVDYLHKPFDVEHLVRSIRRILGT